MKKFFDKVESIIAGGTVIVILGTLLLCSFWSGYYWDNGNDDKTCRELKILQEQIVELSQDNKRSIKKK